MAEKIVVASGKGGVGKTTVSVGLAKALSALKKKVLIIDCDNLHCVDVILGLEQFSVYNWGDAVLDRCSIQQCIYEADGVFAAVSPADYSGINKAVFIKMIEEIEGSFDYIIFDSPAGIEKGFALACSCADRGLVIATPDKICVKGALRAGRRMEEMEISSIRLIINRAVRSAIKKKNCLNIDGMIDETEIQLLGIIPEDRDILRSSISKGIYNETQISFDAFNNIANRIMGKYVPLAV